MNVQKLLSYIEMHHIAVVGQVERSGSTFIRVNSLYCKDSSAQYEIEEIPATWQAVRDYLGY